MLRGIYVPRIAHYMDLEQRQEPVLVVAAETHGDDPIQHIRDEYYFRTAIHGDRIGLHIHAENQGVNERAVYLNVQAAEELINSLMVLTHELRGALQEGNVDLDHEIDSMDSLALRQRILNQ